LPWKIILTETIDIIILSVMSVFRDNYHLFDLKGSWEDIKKKYFALLFYLQQS